MYRQVHSQICLVIAETRKVQKRRPVDILQELLVSYGPKDQRVRSFFECYGAAEACAMCWHLASASPADTPMVSTRRPVKSLSLPCARWLAFVSSSSKCLAALFIHRGAVSMALTTAKLANGLATVL